LTPLIQRASVLSYALAVFAHVIVSVAPAARVNPVVVWQKDELPY
jgi:hypothetical protein